MRVWTLLLVVVAVLAILATTTRGKAIAKRIGFRDRVAGAASTEDVAYLLTACNGDRAELERRIAFERARYPDLTESEHYRRAIRRVFAARESSSSATR